MRCPKCETEPHTPTQIRRYGMCRWCQKLPAPKGKVRNLHDSDGLIWVVMHTNSKEEVTDLITHNKDKSEQHWERVKNDSPKM